jgi:hypothetical protein
MRWLWNGLGCVTVLFGLLGVAGCKTDPAKRPKRPDEYVLPPDDARFQQPVSYPRSVMNQDQDHVPTPQTPGGLPQRSPNNGPRWGSQAGAANPGGM